MPRFVILEHDWPERHWDFLLEAGDVLRAWRLLEEPRQGRTIPAEANFDHRTLYLDYEGPLTGNRGSVTRWDGGTFDWIEEEPDRIAVELAGVKLTGRVTLRAGSDGTGWTWAINCGTRPASDPSPSGPRPRSFRPPPSA